MKNLILVITLVCLAGTISAQDKGVGLGVMIGEPTGLNAKFWLSSKTAFDAGAAWSLDKHAKLHLHFDYLFHKFEVIPVDPGRLPVYFGVGARTKFADRGKDWIGVRIPVGLNYHFKDLPLDLFVELVPVVDLAPDTEVDFNGGFGIRYFFGGRARH